MVEKNWLTAADRATIKYPAFKNFDPNACRTSCGSDKPSGKIVKYVKQELLAMGVKESDLAAGGLRVTTTIDPGVQKAAEEAVARTNRDSPMRELGTTYRPAIVAVSPTNGRVLAYYGGPKGDGVGWDYAGPNYAPNGDFLGGGRPPGSSFKIYTLLAGVSAGYSLDTTWDSTAKRENGKTIDNSSRDVTACDPRRCPLSTATIESYNFPFYWLANDLGPSKVVEAAHAAGVQFIKDGAGKRIDLNRVSGEGLKNFGAEVGFGQYEITPVDHANGFGDLGNNGVYNKGTL